MTQYLMKVMQLFSKAVDTKTDVKPNGLTDMPRPSGLVETDGIRNKVPLTELSTRLSKNFELAEFTNSNTATRLGIDNRPGEKELTALKILVRSFLQPLRSKLKKPMTISSGFRCLELNRSLGSGDDSQHVKGEAVDIHAAGMTALELAEYITNSKLEFDQLILENYEGPGTGWVHVSRISSGNRHEVLTYNGSEYLRGLVV